MYNKTLLCGALLKMKSLLKKASNYHSYLPFLCCFNFLKELRAVERETERKKIEKSHLNSNENVHLHAIPSP